MKQTFAVPLMLILLACGANDQGTTSQMDQAVKLAVQFGQAIVDEDFVAAHALLCEDEQESSSPEMIKSTVDNMISYTGMPLTNVWVTEEFIWDSWQGKRPDELVSIFVGLEGESFVEAVTLVVVETDNGLCIRVHEWGRP